MSSSATTQAAETGPKRPIAVVVACGLMVAVSVTYLVGSALTLTALSKIFSATGDEYNQFDATDRNTITTFKATMVVTIVVYVAITITLLVLAIGNLRGRKGTRIGTWVVAGLFLLCALCGSVGNGSVAAGMVNGDASSTPLSSGLYPTWYTPTMIALDVVLVVLYAGVIILLALPASNRFFRFEKLPPLISSR